MKPQPLPFWKAYCLALKEEWNLFLVLFLVYLALYAQSLLPLTVPFWLALMTAGRWATRRARQRQWAWRYDDEGVRIDYRGEEQEWIPWSRIHHIQYCVPLQELRLKVDARDQSESEG